MQNNRATHSTIQANISYTDHASQRKKERNISNQQIETALHGGKVDQHKNNNIYTNTATKVVTGKSGTVITVIANKRNTNFNLLNKTAKREEYLIARINREHNNSPAMCDLAELYLSGELGNKKAQEAYALLVRAANTGKGNSHAMCLLSNMYRNGDLGAADPKASLYWLEQAANKRNIGASAFVGQHYLLEYLNIKNIDPTNEQEKINTYEKAKKFLWYAADKGQTRAIWQIAQVHEKGLLGEVNLPKAIDLYIKAAMLGSPTSLVNLQELVASGKLNVEAFEEILDRISEFLTTTSQGLAVDIALQQIYGLLGKNSNRGFKMLKVIAEQAGCNNDDAIKELARCYRDGRGCEMNLSLAQYWVAQLQKLYVKAANLGNVQAMHNAGNLYLKGYGRRIDILNAQKMFIKAANTGDIDSIYYLGCLYLNGKLGDHDPAIGIKFINQAIDLWKDLAIRGNTKAIDALVEIYLGKDNADFKSYSEAKNWLNIKLSLNHLDVSDTDKFKLNLISWLSSSPRNFAEGINLFFPGSCEGENDYILDKSCYYLKKILNLESVTSEEKQAIIQKILSFKDNEKKPYKVGRILGDIYSQGVLVEPDYQTSLFWYTKSAMLGNGTAMYHIGKLYETAKLGGIDLVKAVEWYEASAKDNNVAAISCLIRLHNSIGYVAQNITNLNFPHEDPQNMHNLGMQWRREEQEKSKVPLLAAYWLRKAAKREHAESAFILGEMYSNGELGYNLRSVGAKWYKVAAKNGHSIAMHTLYNMYATDNSIVVKSLDKADKWKFRVEKCFNDSVANIKI